MECMVHIFPQLLTVLGCYDFSLSLSVFAMFMKKLFSIYRLKKYEKLIGMKKYVRLRERKKGKEIEAVKNNPAKS